MSFIKPLKSLSVAIALTLGAPSLVLAATPAQHVSIKQQPLAQSLNQLASQFDQVLSYEKHIVSSKVSTRIDSTISFESALAKLLAPHGLSYQKTNNGFLIVADKGVANLPDMKVLTTEHIVIHGQKSARPLSESLSSIDVISASDLHGGKYFSLSDALSEVNNLTQVPGGLPSIRGVDGNGSVGGFSTFASGSKPRMSTMVDGIDQPRGPNWNGDIGLWDVEQIEVYRGPQSTLNGRNSIAGLVFIKTAEPQFDWQSSARVGYRSNDGFLETAGSITGPLAEDELAFRISAQLINGETDTNYTGENYPFNPNNVETKNLRAKLLWTPKALDDLSALLTFSRADEQGSLNFMYDGSDLSLRQKELGTNQDNITDTWSLDLDYQLSDKFTAQIILSDQDYDFYFTNYPEDYWVNIDENSTTFDSQLVYKNTGATLEHALVGLYAYERAQDFSSPLYIGDDKTESTAVYAEGTFAISEDLQVIAGGRFLEEKQQREFKLDAWDVHYIIDKSDDLFLPQLAFNYDINDDYAIGLSAKKGYNPGGGSFNRFTNEHYYFDPETVNAFEFTARASFSDELEFVGHLFLNQYDDYQHTANGASGHWSDIFIKNIQGVETQGAELELKAQITPDFQWHVGVGLLDTEVTETDQYNPQFLNKSLSYAAEFTANTKLTYWLTEAGYVQWHTQYQGEHFANLENSEDQKIAGYSISSISAGYEAESWQANLFINNLFDKESMTQANYFWDKPTVIRSGNLTRSRSIGASVTFHF